MRATRLLGATKPRSARLTVVLDPFVTAQLLGILGETLTGDAVLKGRSMFAGRIGESVAASSLTLVDDATDPSAFTASAVDAEGLATRPTTLIDAGVVSAFLHDAYSARRSGSSSTASATRGSFKQTPVSGALALRLVPGRRTQADLVADVDDGFLVQGVAGLHSGVNPVSGDFSTGAEGLRIRDGALAEPIREVTIASTLQRLLQDVREVGGDEEWLPMNAAGVSLVVADVTMSGT
jgi:PmbA protein